MPVKYQTILQNLGQARFKVLDSLQWIHFCSRGAKITQMVKYFIMCISLYYTPTNMYSISFDSDIRNMLPDVLKSWYGCSIIYRGWLFLCRVRI